jgi:hypothetical protein
MAARRWSLLVMAVIAACGDNLPGEPAPDAAGDDPVVTTYYKHVAPILTRRCVSCHVEDGVAPFALTSYAAAREEAVRIADVTERRIMPPWPAESSGACNTFVDQRRLAADEIATLAAWLRDGALPGDPRDAVTVAPPPPPAFTPGIRLQASAAYTVVNGPDEYRCFIVDPKLVTQQYITAISMQLDRAEIVHHMQLFSADTQAQRDEIAVREAEDAAPGYACDDEGVGPNLRYIGVWAAGDLVRRWPAGTGVRLNPGSHLVLQFHYHNHGTVPLADRTALELETASSVSSVGSILGMSASPLILPPNEPSIAVTESTPVPFTPTYARAVRLHMHEIGIHARMELERDGVSTCMLDIPRWDFGWQLFYTFEQPIQLLPGDRIRVTCVYDTTSRTTTTTWGTSTDDEMCIGYTYIAR